MSKNSKFEFTFANLENELAIAKNSGFKFITCHEFVQRNHKECNEKIIIIKPATILNSFEKKRSTFPIAEAAAPSIIKTKENPSEKRIVLFKTIDLFFFIIVELSIKFFSTKNLIDSFANFKFLIVRLNLSLSRPSNSNFLIKSLIFTLLYLSLLFDGSSI